MGVAGSGKSSVGRMLAEKLGVEYADGDDFHSARNIELMASGVALTDADRMPWLRSIGQGLGARAPAGGVVSCSALRRNYRNMLAQAAPTATFLQLTCSVDVLRRRLLDRVHFMPPSQLADQLATLEPLEADEPGIVLDCSLPPDEIVTAFLGGKLGRDRT